MLEDPLTQNLYTYTGTNPVNLMDPSGHGWLSNAVSKVKQVATNVYNTVKNTVTNVYNTAKNAVTNVYNTVTNAYGGGSSNSGGEYTDPFAAYLANQADSTPPVDPVTASLQSRFGGANVTNVTSSYAYVDGKLVTALSEAEYKMCTDAKRVTNKAQSPEVKVPKCFR